jgi:hypothetical protein
MPDNVVPVGTLAGWNPRDPITGSPEQIVPPNCRSGVRGHERASVPAVGYENYTLGDATQQTLREIWNGQAYQRYRAALHSDAPPKSCASCGLRWSL